MSTLVYFPPTLVTAPDIELKKDAVNRAKGVPATQPISNRELANWDVYQCPGENRYSIANNRITNPSFSPSSDCSRPPSFTEKLNETFGVNGPPSRFQRGRAVTGFSLALTGTALIITGVTLFGIGQAGLSKNGDTSANPDYYRDFNLRSGGIGTFSSGIVAGGIGLVVLFTLPINP